MDTLKLKGERQDAGALAGKFSYFAFKGSTTQEEKDFNNQMVLLGKEQVVEDDKVKVYLVYKNCDLSLVELPAESDSGFWRYWVRQSDLSE